MQIKPNITEHQWATVLNPVHKADYPPQFVLTSEPYQQLLEPTFHSPGYDKSAAHKEWVASRHNQTWLSAG